MSVVLLWVVLGVLLLITAVVVVRPAWLVRGVLAPLLPQVLFCGRGPERRLAITIDDGPSGPGSEALLDLLQELQVPATLFLISGHLARVSPDFVARVLAAGHQIGHHMPADQLSARLPLPEFRRQFHLASEALQQAAAPQPLPLHWFRPGGGLFHAPMLAHVRAAGLRLALGSIFPWDTLHPPAAFQRWFVLKNAHPGGILILHDRADTITTTLANLRMLIPQLQQRGYRFVSLDAL